jgi:UDP:flavonoid glycosyltransferase YjiC (YdhE family)
LPHLTILALGSRGDVLPYLVLGAGLRQSGFSVRVVTFESFGPLVGRYGLDIAPVPGDAEKLMTSAGGLALAESGHNVWKMWQALKRLFWQLGATLGEVLSRLHLWQTDIVINQLPGSLFGLDLAEMLGVPLINVAVMPLARTKAFPMLAFPSGLSFLPGYNALSYRLAEQIVWSGFRRPVNHWRREVLKLPPQPFWGRFSEVGRRPTLLGVSPAVVPRPPDWGAHIHFAGYWLPEEPDWRPTPALLDFLGAGPPPLFIGFGSMPVREPEKVTQVVLEALRQTGQRAVLHSGWAGIGQMKLPNTVYPLDYAPYGWLFPKMAAVVHHGGSGTTGFGLWAGVPTILTPFLFDHFYWGTRIEALGVGPAPIPFEKLTANRLASAIDTALVDTALCQRAAALGHIIRQEDGVANAVTLVKQIIAASQPTPHFT